MKKPLRQPPSQSTRANPKGSWILYHGPFPFAREAVPPARSLRQSWKHFPTPVPVVITQEPEGGGLSFPRESPGFYTERPTPVPGAFPWASAGWGDTVVTKSFLCVAFCALRAAHTMPTNPFLCWRFSSFPARQGAFPGWACPFPPVRREGPSPGFRRLLRACMRELSRMSRNTASKAVSDRPAFFRWGAKAKWLSHFFHPKIGGVLRGRRAAFPFPTERTHGRQSARNYCSPNASRTACTPPAFPPRFPARNTRKTTPCRDRPRPPGSPLPAGAQRAAHAAVPGPFAPPGARLPG